MAKPAEDITLLDIFNTVESVPLFTLHRSSPDEGCAVGRYIQPVLQEKIDAAVAALEAELARVTVADIAARIEQSARACPELDIYHGRA